MTATFDDAKQQEVADFLAATIAFSEQIAVATAELLKSLSAHLAESERRWPRSFLLEVSALACIGRWDRQGIVRTIDPSLPTFQAAWDDLVHRMQTEPQRLNNSEFALLNKVFCAWASNFFRRGWDSLRMSAVLSPEAEDELICEIARLLWSSRERLSMPSVPAADRTPNGW